MSGFVHKEGTGSLFKVTDKKTENHPDLNGSIMLNGKEHWLSGWINKTPKGTRINVSVGKVKEPRGEAGEKVADKGEAVEDFDDDLPF